MRTGDTVWVYPHGSPREAVAATVDILSGSGRSIALRLHERPEWCRIEDGFLVHKEDGRIEMLLSSYPVGPWVEIFRGGHYEIDETQPDTRFRP